MLTCTVAEMEGVLRLHGSQFSFHTTCLLLVYFHSRCYENKTRLISNSYPKTSNLTLEEIDYLFTKEGKKGVGKFTARSQPVQESLRPTEEVEQDVEKQGAADSEDADHVEGKDEKSLHE